VPYLIETTYHTGQDALRDRLLMDHVAYLDANVGRLLAAGGQINDDNTQVAAAFYILDTEERAEAEAFVHNEPFVKGGLIAAITVRRWRKSYWNGARLLADPMRTSSKAIAEQGAPPLTNVVKS